MLFQRKLNSYLDTWYQDSTRKPLVIRGARQVGKTSLVRNWATNKFKSQTYINLENARERERFSILEREDYGIDLTDCLRVIDDNYLKPGQNLNESLLFFDEIQNVPSLIPLLRFFYESRPDLFVIAAGSYFEIKLKQHLRKKEAEFTFPVGRVENLFLYPLDFFEYLEAVGENRLLQNLRSVDWNHLPRPDMHLKASELFEDYFLCGGMPEIVAMKVSAVKQDKFQKVYSTLINGYIDDIGKYGVREPKIKYLEHLLSNAHSSAGKLINYEGFAGSAYRSREVGEAFATLESIMLLSLARACCDNALPWNSQEKKQKKLIFLDTGLVNYQSGIDFTEVKRHDLNQIHRGRLAEQVVGQQLISDSVYSRGRLNYWAKDYRQGSAEVDFCIDVKGTPCGIEVKSGAAGTLKSLIEFAHYVDGAALLRVYSGEMLVEDRRGLKIKSLPFYLLPRLRELAIV